MNYYKPLFKKILKLKYNIIENIKIFKFKRKKWEKFIINYKKQSLKEKFNKFKIIDQNKYQINFYASKFESYKNNYRIIFSNFKNITFIYPNIAKNVFINKNFSYNTLIKLENRLDIILTKSKFCLTIRNAQKLINNRFIYVNQKLITNKSYLIKSGDLVKLNIYMQIFEKQLINSFKWPIILNHLIINYNCKEIILLNNLKIINFLFYFPFHLKLFKIFN